ncbi:MAG: DUF2723 domain-containing protein [Candidatus Omnitrophota bacterium]|nr:DUF2723 domain-containing protein [Candidatus Omnitrophota bacterium]MDZ4242293.1 DUF2723 domain-containing protein [Candidatus Omnitrophota bacterium]
MKRLPFKNDSVFLLVALTVISLFLRLAFLSKGPYNVDCLDFAIKSEELLTTGRLQTSGPGYPLFILLGAVFIGAARMFSIHDPVIGVNVMSAFFGAMSVGALFVLLQNLLNRTAAFFGAVMLSVFPICLAESTYGKNHTASLFFLLAGLAALASFQTTGRKRAFISAATLLGAMGATRIQDLPWIMPAVTVLFFWPPGETGRVPATPFLNRLKLFTLMITIAASVMAVLHLPFILGTGRGNYLGYFAKSWDIGVTANFRGLISPSLLSSLVILVCGLTPVGFLLSILGTGKLAVKNRRVFYFLLTWLVFTLGFFGNLAGTTSRYLLIPAVPLIIAQSYLMGTLWQSRSRLIRYGAGLTFVFIILLLFSQTYPILQFRHRFAPMVDFSYFVRDNTAPNAVIIASDEGWFIRYYAEREPLKRPDYPAPPGYPGLPRRIGQGSGGRTSGLHDPFRNLQL